MMNVDLRHTLHDVVDPPAGHLPVAARGMSGADDLMVGALTGRIRRRRVVRTGGRAAIGVVAAGVLVAGGMELAGREAPAPADTPIEPAINAIPLPGVDRWVPPLEDEDPTMGRWLDLGDPAPTDLLIDPGSVHIEAALDTTSTPFDATWSGYGEPMPKVAGTLTIVNGTDATFTTIVALQPGGYLVRDGVVVEAPSQVTPYGTPITLDPGESRDLTFTAELLGPMRPDAGVGMAGPGAYLIYPSVGFEDPVTGRQIEVYGAPLSFTVTGDAPRVTPEEQAAIDELVALLRDAGSADPFPACGSLLPASGSGPLDLAFDLPPDGVFGAGNQITADVEIRPTSGLRVVGSIPVQGAAIVLERNATVVGGGYADIDEMLDIDLSSGETLTLPATATLTLCSSGTPLPRGTYLATVVLRVELDEVTEPDGTRQTVPSSRVLFPQTVAVVTVE